MNKLSHLLKATAPDFHKGNFGHVAIFSGDPQTLGASRLAALASLRAGAGLCTLIHAPKITPVEGCPEFLHRSIASLTSTDWEKFTATVIGPGLGNSAYLRSIAHALVCASLEANVPVVLDAEALLFLLKPKNLPASGQIIATPHPKEAARLIGDDASIIQSNRGQAANRLLSLPVNQHLNTIWVLKGADPIVCSISHPILTIEGSALPLAVGGSGDVLAGVIAALIAQTNSPFDATHLAVAAHLSAGQKLAKIATRGHLASEIANQIPSVLFPPN